MTLCEVGEGFTVEDIKNNTGCAFKISDDLKRF